MPNPGRQTSPKVLTNAYGLRHNQTEAESVLWGGLRSHQLGGYHFRRQHAIGPYIVDFCCVREKVIVEIDGGQHLDQAEYDFERTAFLESQGYRVIRFWNDEVLKNREAVLLAILEALEKKPPPSLPQMP